VYRKSGEASDEKGRSGEGDDGCGGVGAELVVFAAGAESDRSQANGAFDQPTPGQVLAAFLGGAAPDDFQTQWARAEACGPPAGEFVAGVTAVGPR
jgi:hypothetical protein